MKCTVLRPFSGPEGKMFAIGERVNTSGWKNREVLIKQRYIQPSVLSSGTRPEPPVEEEEFRPAPSAKKEAKKVRLKRQRFSTDTE